MRPLIGILLLVLSALLLLCSAFNAHAYDVGNDLGGIVYDYVMNSEGMKDTNEPVRFNGVCASACTLYIELPKTCVTPEAEFIFHKPFGGTKDQIEFTEGYLMSHYPKWVQVWIDAHGGLQANPIIMPYSVIKKHMRHCPE